MVKSHIIIPLNLKAHGSATAKVQAPVNVFEAAKTGKRVLEEEFGLEVALTGYKAPRQQQTQLIPPGDGEQLVERGSSLEFTSALPKTGLLSLYAEDKMLSFLSQISARMLGGPPVIDKKTKLEELLSGQRHAAACKVLEDIKLPTIKKPAELGQLLDNAYFERNRSQHSDDARLARQIKKFVGAGGLVGLREEYPNECVILESFDKITSLFV